MITPTPQDPLAALKKLSPGDPIIPAFEHINTQLDSMKSHAKSIAHDAKSLLNTRRLACLAACLLSAAAASAGTWYAMRRIPPSVPELEILRRAGITLYVSEDSKGTGLQVEGREADIDRATTERESSQPGHIFVWRKQ
jgi:hypothetical protein